jgi:hypothetical protein
LQQELSASREGQMQTKEELDKTLTQNEFLQKRLRNIQIEFDLLRAEKRKRENDLY